MKKLEGDRSLCEKTMLHLNSKKKIKKLMLKQLEQPVAGK